MIVELGELSDEQWDELRAGEESPWGSDGLEWQKKERLLLLRVDGRLVAMAGWSIVAIEAGGETFDVVGLGAVVVSRPHRGKGYARRVMEPWLERAGALGPARAALFCAPHNVGLYARFGFSQVRATVTADQPTGPITMPGAFMWRPLRADATWPDGPVRVLGLPF